MFSLLEQIKKGKLWRYFGGVHPNENKTQSTGIAIADAGIPNRLIIPVKQHIGTSGKLAVAVGDCVLKGQPLTESDSMMTVPVHAPTSGRIVKIGHFPGTHPSTLPELAIELECDGQDRELPKQDPLDYHQCSALELQHCIRDAGITGMGGAGFPTAVKLLNKHPIQFLLINAAECEPYITSDDMLMREHADEVIKGIDILANILKPEITIIGIEDNKPEAAAALTAAAEKANLTDQILLRKVPTKYPNGGEKQLIKVLTGIEVKKGQIPAQSGIVMQNVGTVFAIKQAVIDRQPLIQRVVTLTGKAFPQPQNVWALNGTSISYLLEQFNCDQDRAAAIIYGGPMMGFTLPGANFSLTKTGNCILVPEADEIPQVREPDACIRCGECAEVCPMDLLPQQLHWYSVAKNIEKLKDYKLMDCIECGSCSYACPSQIPLVHEYRIAKVEVREHDAEKQAAATAKERFEKRNERIAKEKELREARQQEAAAKRRQTAQAATGEDPVKAALARINKAKQTEVKDDKKSAIADAIARAKAKKTGEATPDNSDMIAQRKARKELAQQRKMEKAQADTNVNAESEKSSADGKKDAVAAAIARAKAKKAAQQGAPEAETTASTESTPASDKKAAVAAAIARAKAKKAAQQASTETSEPAEVTPVDDKKAAVAAAIARAKAKKAAQQTSTEASDSAEVTPVDDKKAAVAAAIARAKAKKAAQQTSTEASDPADVTPIDDKKAAVAAAIAKAKAKKAAQEASTEASDPAEVTPVDDKKAAVAAAIAKAKAKKAAQQVAQQANLDDLATVEVLSEVEEVTAVDNKKAAVAAAIARAKAKKAEKLAHSGNK